MQCARHPWPRQKRRGSTLKLRRFSTPLISLDKIVVQIAAELKARPAQVLTAVELFDGGATVPFIARYRKEATEGLDESSCVNWKAGWPTCASWKTAAAPCSRASTSKAS